MAFDFDKPFTTRDGRGAVVNRWVTDLFGARWQAEILAVDPKRERQERYLVAAWDGRLRNDGVDDALDLVNVGDPRWPDWSKPIRTTCGVSAEVMAEGPGGALVRIGDVRLCYFRSGELKPDELLKNGCLGYDPVRWRVENYEPASMLGVDTTPPAPPTTYIANRTSPAVALLAAEKRITELEEQLAAEQSWSKAQNGMCEGLAQECKRLLVLNEELKTRRH